LAQRFFQSSPAPAILHYKKYASSDFSIIEWDHAYFLVIELPVLIKKVLDRRKKPILLLICKTRGTDVLHRVDENRYGTIAELALEEIVESVENFEVGAFHVPLERFVFIGTEKRQQDISIFVPYWQSLKRMANERAELVIPSVYGISDRFDLAVVVFQTHE
jgi:hypothetical protein